MSGDVLPTIGFANAVDKAKEEIANTVDEAQE
jgi:hypothetical protein